MQLDARKLFGKHTPMTVTLKDRHVRSNDKKSVTTYVEAMYDHLFANSSFKRSKELEMHNPEANKLAENLDKLIGQASEHAEKQCSKRRPEWFSIKLTNQRLTVSYLRQKSISKLNMIGSTIDLPNTEEELRDLLAKERLRLDEMQQNSR